MTLSASQIEQLEQILSQIADLAGSQGLSEIERLTEAALDVLDGAEFTTVTGDRDPIQS